LAKDTDWLKTIFRYLEKWMESSNMNSLSSEIRNLLTKQSSAMRLTIKLISIIQKIKSHNTILTKLSLNSRSTKQKAQTQQWILLLLKEQIHSSFIKHQNTQSTQITQYSVLITVQMPSLWDLMKYQWAFITMSLIRE